MLQRFRTLQHPNDAILWSRDLRYHNSPKQELKIRAALSAAEIGKIMIANKNSSSKALRLVIGGAYSPFSLIDVSQPLILCLFCVIGSLKSLCVWN
ncbi:hypothetical protein CsSME_00012367 [Camellia sinensis var. sinensis]